MLISLDTNIWIFGVIGADQFCEKIIRNLPRFNMLICDQIRAELEQNLSHQDMKEFYSLVKRSGTKIDFGKVPDRYSF
jgi:predicted nucleic acid-binding protein